MAFVHADLGRVPVDRMPNFVHRCIDALCGREGVRQQDWVPAVFEDGDGLSRATAGCQQVLMQAIDSRDQKDTVNGIPDEYRNIFYECVECRKPELRSGVIAAVIRNSGRAFVLDSDWRVNYILSSSKVTAVAQPIATFTFALSTPGTCTLELSLCELDSLLQVLRDAQTSLCD